MVEYSLTRSVVPFSEGLRGGCQISTRRRPRYLVILAEILKNDRCTASWGAVMLRETAVSSNACFSGASRAAKCSVIFALCVNVAVCTPSIAQAHHQPQETMTALADAASRREKSAHTLRIAWTEHTVWFAAANGQAHNPPGAVAVDTSEKRERTSKCAVTIDGTLLRFSMLENDGTASVSAFDGKTYRKLVQGGSAAHPRGVVAKVNRDTELSVLKPILWTFRLLNQEMRILPIEDFDVAEERVLLDGRACILINDGGKANSNVRSFWLDPERDYSVLKYTFKDGRTGALSRQMNVSYVNHPVAGWVPSGWSVESSWADGSPMSSVTANVTDTKINQAVEASEFAPVFPSGTFVTESEGDSHRLYAVRPDGTRRPISTGELLAAKSYQQLLAEPGQLPLAAWYRYRWAFVAFNVALFVVIGGYLLYGRMNRLRSSTH